MGACQARRIKSSASNTETTPIILETDSPPKNRTEVWLNTYDLLMTNYTTSKFGLGIYHTGVVIYGVEYCYSGPQEGKLHLEVTGLRTTTPGDSSWIEDAVFREPILVGHSKLSPFEVNSIYLEMCKEYKGPSYNVLNRNCNHFTRDFLLKILDQESLKARGYYQGEDILPPYIDRITKIATKVRPCLPKIWTTDLREQYEDEQKRKKFLQNNNTTTTVRGGESLSDGSIEWNRNDTKQELEPRKESHGVKERKKDK